MTEDTKQLESLDYKPPQNQEIKTGAAVRNKNIMIIEEIEGLMTQVNNKLDELEVMSVTSDNTDKRDKAQHQATEEIDLFQKTTLFELRKAFE